MAGRQDEPVAVGPGGVRRVVAHDPRDSTYASGASAIAVPGWPALAFCTASIASARIMSIVRWRGSEASVLMARKPYAPNAGSGERVRGRSGRIGQRIRLVTVA